MKRRKRMGLPKARVMSARRRDDAATVTTIDEAVDMLREIMEEQQLAAKQSRLLAAASNACRGESTPVKFAALLDRISERESALATADTLTGRKRAV